MKLKFLGITFCLLFSQIFLLNDSLAATSTVNISGWEIQINNNGICAFGKLYEFGARDSVAISITSYGSISISSDKDFGGIIIIDDKNIIHPITSMKYQTYTYTYSDNSNKINGVLFIKYFKLGNTAKIKMSDGEERTLSLKGFSKAYQRYKQCAR